MKFYFGTPGWGWRLYGIGYKTLWFLGFSIQDAAITEQKEGGGNADQA